MDGGLIPAIILAPTPKALDERNQNFDRIECPRTPDLVERLSPNKDSQITQLMFCSSLRKRPEWAPIVRGLLASQTPRWTEKDLGSHDMMMHLPQRDDREDQQVRMLLLSARDMRSGSSGLARLERLYHLEGGGHRVAVVFLMDRSGGDGEGDGEADGHDDNDGDGDGDGDGVRAYMELQARLLSSSFEMHIIPLSSPLCLQVTLLAYQRQIVQAGREVPALVNPAAAVVLLLLPYCTTNGAPAPEHTVNVLSDLFRNFRELATAATTAHGRARIREWLGASSPPPRLAEGLIEFWLQEYVAE